MLFRSNQITLTAQPNPASDLLHLTVDQPLSGAVRASLISADGRLLLQRSVNGLASAQVLTLDVQEIPSGVYLVRLESGAGVGVQKVVIR